MGRPMFLTTLLFFLAGFAGVCHADQRVVMPELNGEYICNDTVRYATALFGQPILAADSLIVHWRGEIEPGTALVNGELRGWDGCISIFVEDAGANAHAGLIWVHGGQFDCRSAFVNWGLEFLQDGQCSLSAFFDSNWPGPDDTFQLVTLPTCRLDYVELVVPDVVPVLDETWGSVKALYR